MTTFTKEEIDALYAPFPIEAHTTREGHKNKAGTKIQWFTYLDRAAVQRRLETLFPGEWSIDIIETHRESDYVTVSLKMTIRGISRSCNGGQSLKFDKDTIDEDKEKGAWTEAFRRVASVWGIGLYLYEMDFAIWTDSYESGNWDQQKQRTNEAKSKFADWYNKQAKPAVAKPTNGNHALPPAERPTVAPSQNGNGSHAGDKPAQPKGSERLKSSLDNPKPYGKIDGWPAQVASILSGQHHVELSASEVAAETVKLVQANLADASKTTIAELVAMLGNNRLAEDGNLDPASEIRPSDVTEHQPAMLMLGDLIDSPDLKKLVPQDQHRRNLVNLLAKHGLFTNCETTPDMMANVNMYIEARAKGTEKEKTQEEAIAIVKATLERFASLDFA